MTLAPVLALPVEDAHADETASDIELKYDLRIDLPVTLGQSAALLAYVAFGREQLLPSTCNWCDGPRPGVNAVDQFFRDAFVRQETQAAGITSHAVSYVTAPLLTAGLLWGSASDEGHGKNFWVDGLIVAESTITAVSISEVLKALLYRERPNVHATVDDAQHAVEAAKPGANLSFPSGHTLAVMALTASAGTVAGMRRYRATPAIWICGTMLALAAGYLRMAADQHYFTDTLAGAAMGLGIGAGVPLLFHGPRAPLHGGGFYTDGRTLNVALAF
jgi:membrane-associated phospholipid phosphatase